VFASAEEFLGSKALSETSCAVVDVQMPGMSGLELQQSLAAAGWRIPLIFITGYAETGVRDQALQAGAVCCLRKPCDEIDLIAAIRAALESRDSSPRRRINDNHDIWPPLQSSRVVTPLRRRATQ
jgi:FixJ family two-component response regulator